MPGLICEKLDPYQSGNEWFFEHDAQQYGPYDTRRDAESDLRGLRRFERYKNTPGFITTDPPEQQQCK